LSAEDELAGKKSEKKTAVNVREVRESDLEEIMRLWNDGEVMKFVGFPQGLGINMEEMLAWYQRLDARRPLVNAYAIYADGLGYCGESFYRIEEKSSNSAALDIKLFKKARGQGLGTIGLTYAIEQAFAHGASRVWVDPHPENEKALALYRRLGFVEKKTPAFLKADESHMNPPGVYMEITRGDWFSK